MLIVTGLGVQGLGKPSIDSGLTARPDAMKVPWPLQHGEHFNGIVQLYGLASGQPWTLSTLLDFTTLMGSACP